MPPPIDNEEDFDREQNDAIHDEESHEELCAIQTLIVSVLHHALLSRE